MKNRKKNITRLNQYKRMEENNNEKTKQKKTFQVSVCVCVCVIIIMMEMNCQALLQYLQNKQKKKSKFDHSVTWIKKI